MARWIFPSDASRAIFNPGKGSGRALTNTAGVVIQIFVDEACTQLADIQTLDSQPIVNSAITVGTDTLIPNFLGPDDDTKVLYAKAQTSETINTFYARENERLEALENWFFTTSHLLYGITDPSNGTGVNRRLLC